MSTELRAARPCYPTRIIPVRCGLTGTEPAVIVHPMHLRLTLLAILCASSALLAPVSHAVVVAKDNSAAYTQAPADDFGFSSVAIVFNSFAGIPASGVYLGDGWILSAYHNVTNGSTGFTFGSVTLGGLGYAVDAATATRLHNDDNSLADLAMFRLTAVPAGVPSVNLAGISPTILGSVIIMGNGNDREPDETHWSVTWQQVPGGGVHTGYELLPTRALRWGNNNVDAVLPTLLDTGFGNVHPFLMDFDPIAGEGAGVFGDSGGGVFQKRNNTWELVGITVSRTTIQGQPDMAVVYGSSTIAANVANYREEILDTMANVPEPGTTALLLLGGACFSITRRRRNGSTRS